MDPGAVWLYSLATNSWRRLVDPYLYIHYHTILRMGASSSNGRMHNWILTHDLRWQMRDCLLSFDMVDEVFVETPLSLDAPYLNGFLYQGSNNIYPTVYCLLHNIELHIWVLQGYGTTGVWNKQLNITFPQLPRSLRPSYMVLWKKKEIVFISSGTITSLNLTTQEIKSLRIPADGTLIGYTESLVSIAKSIRQPPTMDHSSVETQINVLQHQLPLQLGEEGPVPVDDQQDLSETTMIHQMLPKEDDDSDDSSTDSAFLTPDITAFSDPNTIYIDYEADADFHPHRKNEVERLSKLPYCLHEVNQPMISNPCTF
ncbi:uncharacterized protein LOC104893900 isoform X2 [Beta vulgaris subsp. vulgaris]|nr:uncharacterized protein LOC104893900 isoform X2 [Beta vulgaris subsp. vulgaris]XP_057251129.1 uncharacterized protein LOC104893900 isoform X2 [Beta vulgaris subsp. vulgaris]